MVVETSAGIRSVSPVAGNTQATKAGAGFSQALSEAINQLDQTEAASQQQTMALLTGQDESIHQVMIESEKAQLALSLAIQVRNKVLEAYKEMMQMQI